MKKIILILIGLLICLSLIGCNDYMKFDSVSDMAEVVEGTWECGIFGIIINDNEIYEYCKDDCNEIEKYQVEYKYKQGKIDGGEYGEYYVTEVDTIINSINQKYKKISDSTNIEDIGSINVIDDNSEQNSSTTVDTSSTVTAVIPDSLSGLIDESMTYEKSKTFYVDKTDTIVLTSEDSDGLMGKFEHHKNGEYMYSEEWKYIGSGIIQQDVGDYKYRHFIHQDYLVKMDKGGLIDEKLNGNREDGFSYKQSDGKGWTFYEDGTVRFWPNSNFSTSQGTYEMVSDTIMKVITTYDNETTINFYLIDNENYMYRAYPSVWRD